MLAAFVVAGCGSSPDVDREQVIENVKLEVPQLRSAQSLELDSLRASDVEGFQEATLVVNGRNRVPVLISNDGEKALLLASEPLDVSRSMDEMSAQMDEEAKARSASIDRVVSQMPVRGPKDAPVTLVEFSDFQCPYCAQATGIVDQLREKYPERLNFVFAHYPLPMHEWAKPASIAAQCAARQDADAFWALHDAYFENQSSMSTANVIARSTAVLKDTGIDVEQWRTCAADTSSEAYSEAEAVVDASMRIGREVGVQGTPTFYVNGTKVESRSMASFEQAIEQAAGR
jgi:protein-disulfide isomerase